MFGYWKRRYHTLCNLYEKERDRVVELEQELDLLRESKSVSVGNHTLTRDCFNKLKQKVSNTHLSSDSSAGALGYKLGIAHCLDTLETTHVIN